MMKAQRTITLVPKLALTFACMLACAFVLVAQSAQQAQAAQPSDTQIMYRVYNPNSGEHFYTASTAERDNCVKAGWNDEGRAWLATKTGDPVYRLYNKNGGEHHYTMSETEKNDLEKKGWTYEGIGWRSNTNKYVRLYRLYNPNEFANNHHYTTSKEERQNLIKAGWKAEGDGWYGAEWHATIHVADHESIQIQLDSMAAPKTVDNFVTLANQKYYDGLTFHRAIKDFLLEGGDAVRSGGQATASNIQGEFTANGFVNNLKHTRGTISMSRGSEHNSARSGFFIVHKDSPQLNGNYAAFGRVTDGMDTVDEICGAAEMVSNSSTAASDPKVIQTNDNGDILYANKRPVITSITTELR